MVARLETYREDSVQACIDQGIKPRIIRVKSGIDLHQPNTKVIAYEFTMHGEYFRVPRVRVIFAEDIEEPLFDDRTNTEIDGGILRILSRQDKQRNAGLVKS